MERDADKTNRGLRKGSHKKFAKLLVRSLGREEWSPREGKVGRIDAACSQAGRSRAKAWCSLVRTRSFSQCKTLSNPSSARRAGEEALNGLSKDLERSFISDCM